jgi:hypothetical protein
MLSILAIVIPATPFLFALWFARTEVSIEAARAEVDQ